MSVKGEIFGEGGPKNPTAGEDGAGTTAFIKFDEIITDNKLTFEEASKCLNTLGKDETGSRYAYLAITATDRKLTDVKTVLNFKHVLFIDLSGNYLDTDALQVLAEMPYLILLKAERNRVESASLRPMYYLQVLSLNQNQIKETATINQPLLESLELNYNDIYVTQFDTADLGKLKQLELRSNLLFEVSGTYPPILEKLYLAANKISTINPSDFSKVVYLETLHLRDNTIEKLDGFTRTLVNLKYLNLRNNKIKRMKEILKLQCLPKLETLIVSGNPFAGSVEQPQPGEEAGEGGVGRDAIRVPILVLLPNLKRINKLPVTLEDRIEAEEIESEVLRSVMDEVDSEREETGREGSTATDLTTEYKTESESERNDEGDETPKEL